MAKKNVTFARPKGDSLEAFKTWIGEFFERLTGRSGDDGSISEEEWEESW